MVAELINFEQGCVDNDNSSCTLGVIQKDSREKKEEDVHDEAISIESLPTTNLLRVEAGNNTDAFQHHLKIEKKSIPSIWISTTDGSSREGSGDNVVSSDENTVKLKNSSS